MGRAAPYDKWGGRQVIRYSGTKRKFARWAVRSAAKGKRSTCLRYRSRVMSSSSEGSGCLARRYEAVDFRSNRGMAEVIRKFFGKADEDVTRKRPDFVALTDSSIGAYAANSYAENSEAFGYRKVLIVELKRGGFTITQRDVDQARDYIKEIRATECVEKSTHIEAYILGSSMEEGLESSTYGNTSVMRPIRYDNLLTRAHVRTSNLHQKMEAIRPSGNEDPELKEVLSINKPLPLFVS